jgi:hypothetical protein
MVKLYQVMPDGGRMFETVATGPEMAYRAVCCFYSPERKIAVHEVGSDVCHVYSRKLDRHGNMVELLQH